MPDFILHDDIKDDFRRIAVISSSAVSRILAALEAASEDETLLKNLHSNHYRTYGDQDTDLKRWVVARQLGYSLSRLRFFWLEEIGHRYRVIYAIDDEYDECHILAILHRDEINYDDPNNPFNQRIFKAFDDLGF